MTAERINQNPAQAAGARYWISLALTYLLLPIILFLCAWNLAWWQAWIFSMLIFAAGIGSRMWGERRHPGLLTERANFEHAPQVKPWDKVLAPLMAISVSFPLVIVAGLDYRFQWSPVFPIGLNILGFLLNAIGYAFASWAMAENRFFSGVVRIQED